MQVNRDSTPHIPSYKPLERSNSFSLIEKVELLASKVKQAVQQFFFSCRNEFQKSDTTPLLEKHITPSNSSKTTPDGEPQFDLPQEFEEEPAQNIPHSSSVEIDQPAVKEIAHSQEDVSPSHDILPVPSSKTHSTEQTLIPEPQILRQYVNIAAKNLKKDPLSEKTGISQAIVKKYEGQKALENLERRQNYALELYNLTKPPTGKTIGVDDKDGLERIVKNRLISKTLFATISRMEIKGVKPSKSKVINILQAHINELDNPESKWVVKLPDGSCSFTIPLTSNEKNVGGHYISLELKKFTDNSYQVIIHNRGGKGDYEELYGNLALQQPDGQIYGKTSIAMNVTKEELSNREFIKGLVESFRQPLDKYNELFRTYFPLDQKVGPKEKERIVRSSEEKELTDLINEEKKMNERLDKLSDRRINTYFQKNQQAGTQERAEIDREQADLKATIQLHQERKKELSDHLCRNDPSFHTIQTMGSCTESNATGSEKAMASDQTRRALKLFTIQKITEEISNTSLPDIYKADAEVMQLHALVRIQGLKQKIGNG